MADTVIVVSGKPEEILHPKAKRHLRIRVMPTDNEDQGMDENEPVEKRCQRKTAIRCYEDRKSKEDRSNFEKPGSSVKWTDAGDEQEKYRKGEEDGWLLFP